MRGTWQRAHRRPRRALPTAAAVCCPAAAVLPQELLALLPAEVQQQVLQQGYGVLNGALVMQLQQLQAAAGAPSQPLAHHASPPAPRAPGFGVYGGSPAAQRPLAATSPPYPYDSPLDAALSPGSLGHSLQRQLHLQQQQRVQLAQGLAAAVPALSANGPGASAASVFLQHMQQPQPQQHAQQQQQQQELQQAAVQPGHSIPFLRSEPVAEPQPEPAASAADVSDKAALLVALARSVGVSSEALTQALREGGRGSPDEAAQAAAAAAAGASTSSGAAQPGGEPRLPQQQPLLALLQAPQQGQHGSNGGHVPPAAAAGLPSLHTNGTAPGSSGNVNSSSIGQPPSVGFQLPQLGQQQQEEEGAPPAGPPPPPPFAAAAGPSHLLDVDQLQSAVQNGGLDAGFASDASLLLQLVAAVEASQRQAGPGAERMQSLSLKLFNVRPRSLSSFLSFQTRPRRLALRRSAESKQQTRSRPRPACRS